MTNTMKNLPETDVSLAGGATETTLANIETLLTGDIQADIVEIIRHDYAGVNVTTAAYVQLIASTAAAISAAEIFDSSGQTMVLAIGPAAGEVDKLYIIPGGNDDIKKVAIPAGSRVSVKAVSADATVGELTINFMG